MMLLPPEPVPTGGTMLLPPEPVAWPPTPDAVEPPARGCGVSADPHARTEGPSAIVTDKDTMADEDDVRGMDSSMGGRRDEARPVRK
jgi:hypothetical protein